MAAAAAKGVSLNHVSRESSDIKRLAQFYIEVFGFQRVESPKFEFDVIWLKLEPSFYLHLIERDPATKLPEGPWSSTSAVADPKNLPRGHHICFSVSNFDSFVQAVKLPSADTKQYQPRPQIRRRRGYRFITGLNQMGRPNKHSSLIQMVMG